jgi:hypothetical protein
LWGKDGSVAINVEVLKNTLNSFAFIVGAVSALADLLKNCGLELL